MSEDLKTRTKAFSLRCIDLSLALPNNELGRMVRGQLLRCGASVGSNYRAASRAKSPADFISKMGTVEEEADECLFWMEIVIEKALVEKTRVLPLHEEGEEILAIVVASIKTARKRQTRSDSEPV